MSVDPQNASDPRVANHHWYPFLRYLEECNKKGQEASVNNWLIQTGKVKDYVLEAKLREERVEEEKLKKKSEMEANKED
tara:strand:+ start:193 stop:429 length:237 start_codon:yes stop_codon:yes gene_type:complete